MGTIPDPRGIDRRPTADQGLAALHEQVRACRRCLEARFLERVAPVLPAPTKADVVLVGQAPGRLEEAAGRPFSGRAGRQLFRWLAEAGLADEERARAVVYMTSMTKCFPGPNPAGGGDRRPSSAEVMLCSSFLARQLALLRPRLVLAVGQLAIARFLGPLPLEAAVGRMFDRAGAEVSDRGEPTPGGLRLPLVLPLPHPSGASRWLNQGEHQDQLAVALHRLGRWLAENGGEPAQ